MIFTRNAHRLKAAGLAAAICAGALMMGSVNFPSAPRAASVPAPSLPAVSPAGEASPVPAASAAPAVADYSSAAEDGFVVIDGYLYAVDDGGSFRANYTDGLLSFDAEGRYYSGDAELDEIVAGLIASKTDAASPRLDRLHALYNYVRDAMEYVGLGGADLAYSEPNGAGGWGNGIARAALTGLKGNC